MTILTTHPLHQGPLTLLSQGAEAHIYLTQVSTPYTSHQQQQQIIKQRTTKLYRHPTLDKRLIKQRTRAEVKTLQKIQKLENAKLNAPQFIRQHGDSAILMSYLPYPQLKDVLKSTHTSIDRIAEAIAVLHDAGIIHGDLTTSNILVNTQSERLETEESNIYIIDFGLSHISLLAEEKAVDLYVLERAWESTHADMFHMVTAFRCRLDLY